MNKPSYLTKEGAEKIRTELAHLTGPVRLELSKKLHAAIQMGDLSENADYHAAKEEQGFVEGRILELTQVLRDVVIIDETEKSRDVVDVGTVVTIMDRTDVEATFYIVGPHEADPMNGKISFDSPIGQALMGHKENETVIAKTPAGENLIKIVKIE